ncbi:hypothetical protein TRFO_10975 [Tritrichomonas foetus]|uniref:SSD domain-containing protein n=1 Tax=Tritrichomonas foetus TaxID=1144522 RepID=A0A1J4J5U9_9EUKA|nr:hypothetical protein TRFO_10975 [Tritrichomonas foetus]|eukprot:OHS94606.1 hypothetical protein TRFO_10975 [Tritrichomonas foetus]
MFDSLSKIRHVHDPNKIKLWPWMRHYAAFIYKKPYVPIITSIIAAIAMLLWLLLVYGVAPGCNTNYYRWSGDEITGRWDAYVGASKSTYGSLFGMFGTTITLPKQFQLTQMGCLIYERAGGNVMEAKALQEIWKEEDAMHATPGWSDYCFKVPMDSLPSFAQGLVRQIIDSMKDVLSALEEDTKCIAFKSIITEFKNHMINDLNMSDPQPEDLTDELIYNFMKGKDDQGRIREERIAITYLGVDYDYEKMTTTRVRSMFPFGLPLKGYRNKADRESEQTAQLGKWQKDFLKPMKKMQKEAPMGVIPYAGFPFELNYEIADLILNQVWWLVGSFAFLFVFSVFIMKSFFVAIFGAIGVFLAIPCALAILNGIFQIHYIDVINVIALFLICGIGADCLFIIFELFRQAETIYGTNNKRRLAYAAQRGLIALATSISTSGVSFLALCTSGVRIMNFFGIFSFLLLFFTFVFTFTFYLGILAIWAKKWEKKKGCCHKDEPEEAVNDMNIIGLSAHNSMAAYTDTTSESTSYANELIIDYPRKGLFDFLRYKVEFRVDAAGLDIEKYNAYERFFYNYITPVVYYYRLPIVIFTFALTAVFGYFAFQMETKSELQFLSDNHPLQRAYTLALNGFSTALNDFSFVYVWGVDEKPVVKYADKLTIEDYGVATFHDFNITDERVQIHINNTWNLILSQPFIDTFTTETFGVNPWNEWSVLTNIVKSAEDNELVALIMSLVFEYLEIEEPPDTLVGITPEQYNLYGFLWQAILSELAYQEPDSYVPGTLKANTVGFSLDDYSLKYIGMKANMYIPSELTIANMRELYNKAKALEKQIQDNAADLGIPEFKGWMTGVAWLTMVTEEMLPKQVVKDVGYAFGFAAVVILISTFSISYTFFVLVSMVSTIFIILGILYFTGWTIGTNEAIMISIASGFCADFIIQPMLAISHDFSPRSLYGKIQASLTTFCTPVSSALVTTLVAACFLYPCDILLFPPFATFLLGSGIFGIIHGFIVLPALVALLSFNKKQLIPFHIEQQHHHNDIRMPSDDGNEPTIPVEPSSEEYNH